MYGNNNCNCNPCNCNPCNRGGFFANYQAFWIIVVIAIVIIWVHYGANCWNGWGWGRGNMSCGCENDCNPCC